MWTLGQESWKYFDVWKESALRRIDHIRIYNDLWHSHQDLAMKFTTPYGMLNGISGQIEC